MKKTDVMDSLRTYMQDKGHQCFSSSGAVSVAVGGYNLLVAQGESDMEISFPNYKTQDYDPTISEIMDAIRDMVNFFNNPMIEVKSDYQSDVMMTFFFKDVLGVNQQARC